jgi:group II intron reverse transcriptase/maturase
MRTAETILAVIRERGRRGLPLERVYRLLFNQELYLLAYAKLYPNKGAMTRGSTPETVDGMSLRKIDRLIDDLRHERHRWTPARRTYIAKKNGKRRPLGMPVWRDKLLQEVLRLILDAYFEPQFSDHSHGFRAHHGCHTALQAVQQGWKGTVWFIEGDIAQYFDTIDHEVLLGILGEQIHDGRLLRLIRELLTAGYLEDWKFHKTLSGTPQGGVLSPLLSNIYLNRFDHWVTDTLIPAYTGGTHRKPNRAYYRINNQIYDRRKRGKTERVKELVKQRRLLPEGDPHDASFRRLRYVRYADDFLLGFIGTRAEAETIKRTIAEWLSTHLKLTLSDEKTLITHAETQAARFLGYELSSRIANDKLDATKRRSVNGTIQLRVPLDVIAARCARFYRANKVIDRAELLNESDYSIVVRFQQEYRGIVQYYLPAHNVRYLSRLRWVMEQALLRTLAAKHKTTVHAIWQRTATTVTTPEGQTLRCFEVRVEREHKPPLVARFGGLSLKRQPEAYLNDRPYVYKVDGTEILKRVLADACELCGSREDVQVHHIRKLADLRQKGRKEKPYWVQVMAARRRKTLVVCRYCHRAIHDGRPTRQRPSD